MVALIGGGSWGAISATTTGLNTNPESLGGSNAAIVAILMTIKRKTTRLNQAQLTNLSTCCLNLLSFEKMNSDECCLYSNLLMGGATTGAESGANNNDPPAASEGVAAARPIV